MQESNRSETDAVQKGEEETTYDNGDSRQSHSCNEREREIRFIGCHYTRKKNIHAQFAQNLRSQPFNRDRREHRKKETMFSQRFTNSSATLHPYLRSPSFLTCFQSLIRHFYTQHT